MALRPDPPLSVADNATLTPAVEYQPVVQATPPQLIVVAGAAVSDGGAADPWHEPDDGSWVPPLESTNSVDQPAG